MDKTDESTGSPPVRRRLGALLAMVALAVTVVPAAVMGTADPASAYCARSGGARTHPDGVASISWDATTDCSSTISIRLTLRDRSCDGRSVRAQVRDTYGNSLGTWTNSNGCNTSTTGTRSFASYFDRVQLCMWAYNSTGTSRVSCSTHNMPP